MSAAEIFEFATFSPVALPPPPRSYPNIQCPAKSEENPSREVTLESPNRARPSGVHWCVDLVNVIGPLLTRLFSLTHGNPARDNKKHRIVPRYLRLAIRNDEEFGKLFGSVVISQGGVVPHIDPSLLPTGTKKGKGGAQSQEL
ncbi:hypothetical protein B0H19DRAFT_1251079 [Mycena capillaripes]|nr:hypothetical protein B0H19DRAFT_1251079 [Mycena capillaripes]